MAHIVDMVYEELTDQIIAEAAKHGRTVKKISEAPHGGQVIYFDFPRKNDFTHFNPYFMIWTGEADSEYPWHMEFGHWYHPKNKDQQRKNPPTAYYGKTFESLKPWIKDYCERAGT